MNFLLSQVFIFAFFFCPEGIISYGINNLTGLVDYESLENSPTQQGQSFADNLVVPFPGARSSLLFQALPGNDAILLHGTSTWIYDRSLATWEHLSILDPGSRYGSCHGLIGMSSRDRVALFGGSGGDTFVWIFDIGTRVWSVAGDTGTPPSGRSGCGMWPIRQDSVEEGFYVAFGGFPAIGGPLYRFLMSDPTSGTWSSSNPSNFPFARTAGAYWVVSKTPNSRFFIFGGYGAAELSDLHYYEVGAAGWTSVDTLPAVPEWFTDNAHPGARSDISFTQYDESIFLYGGRANAVGGWAYCDIWHFNLTEFGTSVPSLHPGWTFLMVEVEDAGPDYPCRFVGDLNPGSRVNSGMTVMPSLVGGYLDIFLFGGEPMPGSWFLGDLWKVRIPYGNEAVPVEEAVCFGKTNAEGACGGPNGECIDDLCVCEEDIPFGGPECLTPIPDDSLCFGKTNAEGACGGTNGACVDGTCVCAEDGRYGGAECLTLIVPNRLALIVGAAVGSSAGICLVLVLVGIFLFFLVFCCSTNRRETVVTPNLAEYIPPKVSLEMGEQKTTPMDEKTTIPVVPTPKQQDVGSPTKAVVSAERDPEVETEVEEDRETPTGGAVELGGEVVSAEKEPEVEVEGEENRETVTGGAVEGEVDPDGADASSVVEEANPFCCIPGCALAVTVKSMTTCRYPGCSLQFHRKHSQKHEGRVRRRRFCPNHQVV